MNSPPNGISQTSPQQTSPQQTSPQQTSPQQTSPQQTSPQQTSPQQTSPQQTSLQRAAADQLATPIQFLKGAGPKRARLLARLGLNTVQDVLFLFPRDYRDLSDVRAIEDLEEDVLQCVQGTVEEIELRNTGAGRSMLGVLVRQGHDYLRAVWFNQPYMREKFSNGQHVSLSGKPRFLGGRWQMNHPRVAPLDDEAAAAEDKLLPVYPLTEGLAQYQLRRVVRHVVETYGPLVDEVFPRQLLGSYDLQPIAEALQQIHFPSDHDSLERARRRFVFQELFVLQLALALRRTEQREECRAPVLEATAKIDSRIRRLFPFELTVGQREALREITGDMARPWPMNRLLQGEVGSGKTVPAVYAMLLCVAHGYQAVLMTPTEVLAYQHANTFANYLSAARVHHVLLTGGMPTGQRQEVLDGIASGEVDLVIGTQAILQSDVKFAKLGLVVIDEQHKFGVRQRAYLRQAGVDPHYLVMTATPIPRSVSMTLFGDLDLSTLRDNPPGRQPVHTYLVSPDMRARWWEFVRKNVRAGRQAYVIAPLVNESENSESASVQEVYESLANGELEAFRLGLIHGRLSGTEKEAAMHAFRGGETQVLVSTSVVEVGVDVANATLMTIDGAERFGLSQLHQLRGRIARGHFSGYCGIFADPQTNDARGRLDAFVQSTDGFQLAEVDFNLRGPGDLLGTKQHGLPPLRIANLVRDMAVLEEARREAQQLVAHDSRLQRSEHARLRKMVLGRYGDALQLSDAG